jgi:hypothetical protein
VFNFVLGWCLMFLPVMLTDGPSEKIDKKVRPSPPWVLEAQSIM